MHVEIENDANTGRGPNHHSGFDPTITSIDNCGRGRRYQEFVVAMAEDGDHKPESDGVLEQAMDMQ